MRAFFLGGIMRALIGTAIICSSLAISASSSEYNTALEKCLDSHGYDKTLPIDERINYNFNAASGCALKELAAINARKDQELRDFLEHNPRYRVPGQSLNSCWGKPREMPFERSTISVGPEGMHASVWYKDQLPAGCYENAPWDNRDKD